LKRLIFFLFLVASIGASLVMVLFVEQFWLINITGNSGDAGNILEPIGGTGWDLIYTFFNNISDWEFAFDWTNILLFSTIAFSIFCIAILITLLLILLINKGNLNRSRSLYRNAAIFFVGVLPLIGGYIWMLVDVINLAGPAGNWSVRAFPVIFYIPFVTGLVMTIWSAIARVTETNR